ncbi:hypothetical protein D3C83_77120 [compost metagenome]
MRPNHDCDWYCPNPASVVVGRLGSAAVLVGVAVAIARSRPSFSIGITAGSGNT